MPGLALGSRRKMNSNYAHVVRVVKAGEFHQRVVKLQKMIDQANAAMQSLVDRRVALDVREKELDTRERHLRNISDEIERRKRALAGS